MLPKFILKMLFLDLIDVTLHKQLDKKKCRSMLTPLPVHNKNVCNFFLAS